VFTVDLYSLVMSYCRRLLFWYATQDSNELMILAINRSNSDFVPASERALPVLYVQFWLSGARSVRRNFVDGILSEPPRSIINRAEGLSTNERRAERCPMNAWWLGPKRNVILLHIILFN